MNSKLLAFLEEIRTQGNMSKAAQILFVTQPYISRVIKNAENQFGVSLIDRSSHPIQLTYAGERLLSYLQEENRLRVNLDREMTHLSEFKYGQLTIASNRDFNDQTYQKMLIGFHNNYPNIHANVINVSSRDAEKRILSGSVDFFLGKPLLNDKIEYEPITKFPLVIILPNNLPQFDPDNLWVDYNPKTLSQLTGNTFISIPHESGYQRMINSYLNEQSILAEFNMEVPNIRLATKLALDSVGAVITPEYILDENTDYEGKVNLMRIPIERLATEFGISYVETRQSSEPLDVMFDIVRNSI